MGAFQHESQPWFFIVGTLDQQDIYKQILSTLNPRNDSLGQRCAGAW